MTMILTLLYITLSNLRGIKYNPDTRVNKIKNVQDFVVCGHQTSEWQSEKSNLYTTVYHYNMALIAYLGCSKPYS